MPGEIWQSAEGLLPASKDAGKGGQKSAEGIVGPLGGTNART